MTSGYEKRSVHCLIGIAALSVLKSFCGCEVASIDHFKKPNLEFRYYKGLNVLKTSVESHGKGHSDCFISPNEMRKYLSVSREHFCYDLSF